MKILTSYYANIKNIPEEYALISISGGISYEIQRSIDFWEKSLAPSWSIFSEYKDTYDTEEYTKRFKEEILPKVDLKELLEDWEEVTRKETFVLLCYEKPNDFCHRHIVAEAFNELGYDVKEYKKPQEPSSFDDF